MTASNPTTQSSPSSVPLIRRLVSTYLRPQLKSLLVAFALMLVAALMTAGFAKLIQPLMDQVLTRAGTDPAARAMILPLSLGIFACFVVRGLASYGHTLQMARVAQRVIAHIQEDLVRHLLRLDLGFFHTQGSGVLTSRVISDVNVVRLAVTDALAGLVSSLLTLILLVAVMFYQDWVLATLAVLVLPLAAGIVAWVGRRLRKLSKHLQDQTAFLLERLSEIFGGIRHVQAYRMEKIEGDDATKAIDRVRGLNVKAARIGELITPFNEVLVGLTIAGITIYGGYKIAAGDLTPGALMSFIAAFALAYEPMKKLGKLNNMVQMGLGAAERVLALMDRTPARLDSAGAVPMILTSAPTIEFDAVRFGYTPDAPVLDGFSCLCPAGKVTALVGPSGGGKTTVLNLVLRFYDPTSGRILINGQDVQDLTTASLRDHCALVSQDITLFNSSVRDNIRYGRMGADNVAVLGAAKMAAAHDFIMNLPQGYDTIIGENGVLLSGGQRQRLAIARALVRDAPILLLDEATSALDHESEQMVQECLYQHAAGRTTIVVAHRLSTIRQADQILVMVGGRVIESGNHDTLLAAGGYYARMLGEEGTPHVA